jgi:outer membrane protein
MMKKTLRSLLVLGCLSAASLSAAESIGVVNFATCISDSKTGKAEQANFEDLKKQLGGHLEAVEKELNEIAGKLNDTEYMDGLSPEAEMELREKARGLNEEMMRYQNQYYQVLNQANMKIVQQISAQIASASEAVAKMQKRQVVLNKESCFYHDASLDITAQVIAEMDKTYDANAKTQMEK